MRSLLLRRDSLEAIEHDARHAYPDEACGFLCSEADAADAPSRRITTVETAANAYAGERRRRFVITPEELAAAEVRAGARGELVSGFYHSHPDHPALPSAFDTEHAWPWYAYLVVAVDRRGLCSAAAFELDAEALRFLPRTLELYSPRVDGTTELAGPTSTG